MLKEQKSTIDTLSLKMEWQDDNKRKISAAAALKTQPLIKKMIPNIIHPSLGILKPLCRLERVTRKRERKREELFFLFRGRRPSKPQLWPYTAFSRHTHTLTLSTLNLLLFF